MTDGNHMGTNSYGNDDEYDDMKPCPACPDGSVWNYSGPTGKTCPVCNGHAIVHLNGAALTKEEERQRGY